MRALPAAIARAEPALVRPWDVRDVYAKPDKELRDLARQGALLRLAHGYYAVIPESERGGRWRPTIEAAGLAIAQVHYGMDNAVAMGPTAARLLGAIPRALGVATIATPKQRPVLRTEVGRVRFVTRKVDQLDVQRVRTELGPGWVTTPEQTLLDVADRPTLGGMTTADAAEALAELMQRVDIGLVRDLAGRQRKRAARTRIEHAVGGQAWEQVLRV
ncbi:MAG TPA: type IV toxin-antitoxin system AbiEi family antitoxin [Egibacteraceae bacterium]|nr:type IV toxin-antitoxin system AbiEi family antitoxin [Egibacteraceae bacterium]